MITPKNCYTLATLIIFIGFKKIYMCIYENGSCIAASVNLDGTEYKKLKKIDDIYNGGCYAYGSGKIYYTLDYKLYSIDVDGKNEKKITDFKIYNLRVFGENVYFTREVDENIGNIYTLKENGIVEITNSPGYVLNITENYMYFYMLDNKKVYRYDQETSSSEAIIHGGYTEYLFTDDFYAVSYAENDEENAGIYIIPIGGGSKTQVSSFNGSCMSYRDGYIYFINSSKLNYLYRVKIDGSGEECISEEFVFDYDTLNISGKWLYFFSDSDYDRVYRADTESLYVECIEFEDIAVVG